MLREQQEVFEVLGYKIKLKRDEKLEGVSPTDIVGLVNSEAQNLYKEAPNLAPNQVAILLALKFAGEKLAAEKEFRENIKQLHSEAVDALQFIEEVSPSTY